MIHRPRDRPRDRQTKGQTDRDTNRRGWIFHPFLI